MIVASREFKYLKHKFHLLKFGHLLEPEAEVSLVQIGHLLDLGVADRD